VSSDIPKAAIVFGAVTPPQGDLVKAKIHLGCTAEVSSFEVLLQNWDKKYSPGGTYPITVGLDGHVDIGRGSSIPQLITCRVESIKYESPSPDEHYLRVEGRCWGEKLFRRVVTQKWSSQKGEAVVKDLMDSFAGLSHTRTGVELVEDTDTTFNSLEYEDTPLWDVLKYIAESSDKAGIIGYDFRVAPDGKFEFFPKNSKTSPVSLSDILEVGEYRKDIHRIRNKIMVYGLADKSVPLDKDEWTESLTPTDGAWSAPSGTVSLDGSTKVKGSYSIKCNNVQAYYASGMFTLNSGKEVNTNLYQVLSFYAVLEKAFSGNVSVALYDINGLDAWKHITIGPGEWRKIDLKVGLANELEWDTVQSGFDWSQVKKVRVDFWFAGVGEGSAWIDALYFGGRRYAAVREDSASQAAYGLRELTETDEELVSDNECDLRARALLDFFKSPAEYIVVRSTVLDYGTTPILAGDKISLELPNENVNGDYRVETAEYTLDAETQTLEVVLELGKVPPMIADYLYGLRTTTVNVEKLARTKLGKRGIPSVSYGGGLGSHHVGHERGGDAGAEWATVQDGGWDALNGWVSPGWIGPYSNTAAIMKFRTRNKAGSVSLDHHLEPSDNEYGILGSESAHWKEVHALYSLLYGYLRIRVAGQSDPKMQLDDSMLQFGTGGSALDTWLKRTGSGAFEVKNDLVPTGDNAGKIGYGGVSPKRWNELHVVDAYVDQYHFTGNLLPDADDLYDLGENVTPKRWRDLYLAGAIKALADGVAVDFLPNADAAYDLGSEDKRWSDLHVSGVGKFGTLEAMTFIHCASIIATGTGRFDDLNVGTFIVITNARVLQNVTADAAIITSGQFGLGRMPRGTSGHVLEGEGASFDPMFVDPNGRYSPAGHNHAAGNITSGVLDEARVPNVFSNAITFNGGIVTNSVNCSNFVATDVVFENDFRITEAEKFGLPKGLAFLNSKGSILMLLDGMGNLQISGKLSRNRRLKRVEKKGFGA
jgi:hypothetical protein